MSGKITLTRALDLVTFKYAGHWVGWRIRGVNDNVFGNISGDVIGNVEGTVTGNIVGTVKGTINGREWEFIETPEEKLQRLITESGNQELIDTFNQTENN